MATGIVVDARGTLEILRQERQAAARETMCCCGRSRVLLPFPWIHCPKCHHTQASRTRHWSLKCARCGYSFWPLLKRLGMPPAHNS